jgi:hypothetical protein
VLTFTDIRSHGLTGKLAAVDPQQFGGFGPVIPTMIPVPVAPVTPQVPINTSADAKLPAPKALSRILKVKPVIVAACAMTTVFRINIGDEVPSPRKLPFAID